MQPVNLTFVNGRLSPASGADLEILERELGSGEIITTDLRPVQGDGGKAFWAMINAAYKSSATLKTRWDRPEDLADAVKIAVKHRVTGDTLSGTPYFISQSLTKVKDWVEFNRAVASALIQTLGVDPAILDRPEPQEETAPVDEPAATAKAEKKRSPPKASSKAKGEGDPVPVPLALECATRVLEFAEDRGIFGDNTVGQLKTLKTICTDWRDTIPEHRSFVDTVEEYAMRLISSSPSDTAKRAKIRDYVMATVPMTEASG